MMLKISKIFLVTLLTSLVLAIGFAQKMPSTLSGKSHVLASVGIVHKKGFDATPILISELHSLEEIELAKWKRLELKDGTSFDFVMLPVSSTDTEGRAQIKVKGTIKNLMANSHKPLEFLISEAEQKVEVVKFDHFQSVEISFQLQSVR